LTGAKGGLYCWEQVRQYADVILVEGLFDYAVLWQAGFSNVTCSMGNHLNAYQFRQLCDGTRTVYLTFDADTNGSGQLAAQALSDRLREQGVAALRVSLPNGHDPNSSSSRAVTRGSSKFFWRPLSNEVPRFPSAHIQQRTKSGSRCRTDHGPGDRMDQSLSGPRVRPPLG